MSEITIRPITRRDKTSWEKLWLENNKGQDNPDVTAHTWNALHNKTKDVYGLCAVSGGTLVGLLHYILHPVTGSIAPVCYMQDLFVAPDYRGQGIAKLMLSELQKIGIAQNWNRIYWLAEEGNAAAQALYQNIGTRLNFSFHVLPIGMLNR